MNASPDNEIQLKLLRLIHGNPFITQREMNQIMGVSVGKVNYCISALSEKGLIKIERFRKSNHKMAFVYRLTPQGLEEIGRLTIRYLKEKISEYNRIKQEIQFYYAQIDRDAIGLSKDPGLLSALDEIV